MRKLLLTAAAALVAGAALAGPVTDSEAGLRQTYAAYRMALFASNTGNGEATTKAIDSFLGGWSEFAKGAGALPQYADDALLDQTVAAVLSHAEEASKAAKAGKLPEAHEALEGIREQIGDLHLRNGLYTFSDRMNAYHAQMEAILGLDVASLDAGGMERIAEMAGVLAYLADDIAAHPAPEADAPDYKPLAEAFQASVAGLVEAARSGEPEAVKQAIGGLKGPYSKFFVKFG